MGSDSYPDLLERLFIAFEETHTFNVIQDVSAQCRRDLTGETTQGGYLELIERLARQRLTNLAPTRIEAI